MKSVTSQFKKLRVLVVGDIMLDKNIHGNVTRISPEAPIPIVSISHEECRPGGASNAANNFCALGARVQLIGLVGDDDARDSLVHACEQQGINTQGFVVAFERPTIQKVRVYAGNHYVTRYDYEETHEITDEEVVSFLSSIENATNACDCVLFSDYNKGLNHPKLLNGLVQVCKRKNLPLIIDPKIKDCERYKGATIIKPNAKEAALMSGIATDTEDGIIAAGRALVKKWDCNVILTASERGMYVFDCEEPTKWKHIPTEATSVVDVTGAGDTVGAVLACAYASGASLVDCARIATKAAAIAIAKQGTAIVTQEELEREYDN